MVRAIFMKSSSCILRCIIMSIIKNKLISVTSSFILDPQHVNVTLGDIEFAFRMNYSVTSSKNKTGWARGRVLLDQTSYFIKRLFIKDGYLEWDPT